MILMNFRTKPMDLQILAGVITAVTFLQKMAPWFSGGPLGISGAQMEVLGHT